MSDPYYADEFVTLYHGDCREVTEWLEADVLVTDPPYGIGWRLGGLHRLREVRSEAEQSIHGDESTEARDDVISAWGANRAAVVFGSWRQPRPARTSHRLIWHKAGRKPGIAPAPWFPNDEEVYLVGSGWVGSPPRGTVITTTEQRDRAPREVGHPTPKPLDLMGALIERCPPGSVADPFAGSGSTLVAAKRLGRKAIGVELEERYCEIAARRLAQGVLDFGGVA
jgi:DNA modification methylase